jgi:hypothetical protein
MAGHKESVFEGKTLDDAVRMGLDALGRRAEVIHGAGGGSSGFLGLERKAVQGARDAAPGRSAAGAFGARRARGRWPRRARTQ